MSMTLRLCQNNKPLRTQCKISPQQYYNATHDRLTGLYNEKTFVDRVEYEIKYCDRYGVNFAFVIIDINNFRQINEVVGVAFADQILKQVATRIKSVTRTTDSMARLEADQFMLLLPNITTANEVIRIANKILSIISMPISLEDEEQVITACLAISLYPENGIEYTKLKECGLKTLDRIKREVGSGVQFFDKDVTQLVEQQNNSVNRLRDLLAHKELTILYQPIVNIRSGEILQLKATAHACHDNRSLSELLTAFEEQIIQDSVEQSLKNDIIDWLLQSVCEQINQWKMNNEARQYQVCISLSKSQLFDPCFIHKLERIVGHGHIDAKDVAIDIRQDLVMADLEQASGAIQQIKRLGFSVCISDFGNGITDINILKDLPIDSIKLSKALIEDLVQQQDNQIVMFGYITMARMFDVVVIADGVNNTALLEIVSKLNCYHMQGDIIHPQLTVNEIEKL